MQLKELIHTFGERLGFAIEIDDTGVYLFDIDHMQLAIHDLSTIGHVALTGDLGLPPPEAKEGLYRLILEGQYLFQETQGATLALHPETGHFALCRSCPLDVLDGERFFTMVEQFVNTLEFWSAIIKNYRPSVEETAIEDHRTGIGFLGDAFIQV